MKSLGIGILTLTTAALSGCAGTSTHEVLDDRTTTSTENAVTIGEIIDPVVNWLKCDRGSLVERAVCEVANTKFNAALERNHLSLTQNAVVFRQDNITTVNQEHGCVKIKSLGSYGTVTLSKEASFNLGGNLIQSPLVFTVDLPVDFAADIRIRESHRTRVFGRCVDPTNTDDYNARGSVSTRATLVAMLSLEPKLSETPSEYIVTIKPTARVMPRVIVKDIDFRITGRNGGVFIGTDIFNSINTLHELPFKLFEYMDQRSLKDWWNEQVQHNLLPAGVQLGVTALDIVQLVDPNLTNALLKGFAENEAKRAGKKLPLEINVEDQLHEQLRRSPHLQAGENGEYRIVVPRPSLPSPFQWSYSGPIPGRHCVQIHEDSDPHTWSDNYLCSELDLGLRWSQAGPIDNMRCLQVNEAADPYAWSDNYLCSPHESPYNFVWSSAGPATPNCIQISEPADPHTWNDNFLCW